MNSEATVHINGWYFYPDISIIEKKKRRSETENGGGGEEGEGEKQEEEKYILVCLANFEI